MRPLTLSLLLPLLLLGCGEKKPPEVAAAPAPVVVAPAPAPEPEPEPEPAEPVAVSNVSMNVTITYADGSTKSGHVKGLERSEDLYADEGWTTEANRLKLDGESGSNATSLKWDQVKSISIKPGTVPADVSCSYDSNWTPWMYDCTVATTSTITLKDGAKWTAATRHKWRMTFDDDSTAEFWIWKWPAREQDTETVSLDTVNPEKPELYTKLQQQLRQELKTIVVTNISIN